MQLADQEGFDIRFEDRDGYFYAFVTGEKDTLSISMEYWRKVIEECQRLECKRLLVEEDFPNQLSPTDIYTLIVAITKMLTTPVKIAFVDRKVEQNDLNLFGETVAINRGIFGRIFSESADAEEWLRA